MTKILRKVRRTAQFRREYRKSQKKGKDIALLLSIINKLANDEPLPAKYRDHALSGSWIGFRECHIMPIGCWFIKK